MSHEMAALTVTAATIGLIHTLLGPDHYVPFIVLSRARKWSPSRTGMVTILCGLGHILSSVALGMIGIALGLAVSRIEDLESYRGSIAAWAMIAFGLVYLVWGGRMAWQNRPHTHFHAHEKELVHNHSHTHTDAHAHPHTVEDKTNITPWILFTVFVLGPCEPLIPLLMYPAVKESVSGLIWVTVVFGTVTIGAMLSVVMILSKGISHVPLRRLERYTHALAGLTILLCGVAIQFLGL